MINAQSPSAQALACPSIRISGAVRMRPFSFGTLSVWIRGEMVVPIVQTIVPPRSIWPSLSSTPSCVAATARLLSSMVTAAFAIFFRANSRSGGAASGKI